MKAILAIAASILAGCSSNNVKLEPEPTTLSTLKTKVNGPEKLNPPDFGKRTSLRMIRKGEEVRIGDSVESALRVFREEKNSFHIADMPPGWKDPAYTAQGWDNGTTGFAAILYDDKVALALFHEDRSDEARLQEILATYDRMFDEPTANIIGSRVRYWFWDQSPQRLMICAIQTPAAGHSISISLGDIRIMDLLGMNPAAADKDRISAERMFQDGLRTRQSK